MVSCGDADAMVTGNTRRYSSSLEKICKVVDPRPGEIMFGLNMIVHKGRTIFVGDTSVHEYPTSEEMADIAISTARVVRLFGFDPKVAFVSHSTFGQPLTSRTKHIRNAVEILREKKVDFDFDGDMQPDVALNPEYKELYPFSKIVGNANILIMPGQHSAAISYKMMKTLSNAKVIGPLLIGLGLPIEIAPLRSSTSEILNLASDVDADLISIMNLQKNSLFLLKKKQLVLNNNFFIQPHEVVLRSLSDLLRMLGESYYPVRGKKIEKIINEIEKKEHFKVTLGGCIIEKLNQTVIIRKE